MVEISFAIHGTSSSEPFRRCAIPQKTLEGSGETDRECGEGFPRSSSLSILHGDMRVPAGSDAAVSALLGTSESVGPPLTAVAFAEAPETAAAAAQRRHFGGVSCRRFIYLYPAQ